MRLKRSAFDAVRNFGAAAVRLPEAAEKLSWKLLMLLPLIGERAELLQHDLPDRFAKGLVLLAEDAVSAQHAFPFTRAPTRAPAAARTTG